MDSVINVLVTNGIGGCMAAGVLWFLWYTATRIIPRIIDRFSEELKEEREICERRHAENLERWQLMVGHFERHGAVLVDLNQKVMLHHALVDQALGLRRQSKAGQSNLSKGSESCGQ